MRKQLPFVLLALCMALVLLPGTARASETASGTCGDGLTWTLGADGILTISGTGEMYDYYDMPVMLPTGPVARPPWYYDSERDEFTVYNITAIIIESGVTHIGNYAFFDCVNARSVTIPSSVTSIGEAAFAGCTSLPGVTIPGNVTSIGERSFVNCDSLTSVAIPASVTTIEDGAFGYCDNLSAVSVADGNTAYTTVDGVLFSMDMKLLHTYPAKKTAQTYAIPASVTNIGGWAFSGCGSLTDMTIPSGVTTIGVRAFHYCTNMTSVTIPNSVTDIKSEAFRDCALTSVTIPNSVTSIEPYTFTGCVYLTDVVIPDSVTSIGHDAFWSCFSLTNVTIPGSVTSIEENTFATCHGLTSVTLGDGVSRIEAEAFNYCENLASVTIPTSVTIIERNAFSACEELKDIYYGGNKAQWNAISIDSDNKNLLSATIHSTVQLPDGVEPENVQIFAAHLSDGQFANTDPGTPFGDGRVSFDSLLAGGDRIFFLAPKTFIPLGPAVKIQQA